YPGVITPFYSDQGDFIALVGSSNSFGFFWRTRQAFRRVKDLRSQSLLVPGKGNVLLDIRRSDHASFWDQGFPAVLVTDTSFFRNPYYHTPQDSLDKLDVPFMNRIVQAIGHLIGRYWTAL